MTTKNACVLAMLVAAAILPSPARACWDGYAARTTNVLVCRQMDSSPAWDPVTARELADWLVRLEALLPPGYRVEACEGSIMVCRAKPDGAVDCDDCLGCLKWEPGTMWTLFRSVAQLTRARPAAVRAALQHGGTPFTIQLAAGADERGARAVARIVNEKRPVDHGFYEAGGFPADNVVAHVIADGGVYRVWVGAYLTRAEAKRELAKVTAATRLRGFVRPL